MAEQAAPRLMLLMSEIWTMVDPRDLRALVDLAGAAERAGADGVVIGEHILLGPNADRKGLPENPRDWVSDGRHPLDFPHPHGLQLLAAIASTTTRLRLVSAALISPLRHPLVLGKELATLDLVSEGRLVFMPSVAAQEEEYDALGVPFHERGKILDEQLEIWERAWADREVSFSGEYFDFDRIHFEPKAWRRSGPTLWIGGFPLHPAALRRTVRYASGYFPVFPPTAEEIGTLGEGLAQAGRSIDDLELATLLGIGTDFPSPTATKTLGPALDQAEAAMEKGFSTFVLKPSQYIDDPDQLADFCGDALRGLRDRWSAVASA